MQQALSDELRSVIERRLRSASAREVLTIASALCDDELDDLVVEPASPVATNSTLSRFEVQGDVVLDRRTGLMWSRQHIGARMSWADAKKAAEGCSLGGHSDWRLPTIRELLSIVDYERHDPAIDTNVFQCESAWYWSSTPLASSPGDCAWFVSFGSGLADWGFRGGSGFVRACRVGQSVEHWF